MTFTINNAVTLKNNVFQKQLVSEQTLSIII